MAGQKVYQTQMGSEANLPISFDIPNSVIPGLYLVLINQNQEQQQFKILISP